MAELGVAGFDLDLDDRRKWRVVSGVPVFKPHTRILPEFAAPDGKTYPEIRIEVTRQDLPYIAERSQVTGPHPITEGHRIPDPSVPESQQPRIVGWERNFRVGTYGPLAEPCVLADLYYRLDLWEEAGPSRYPFRSVDYDFAEQRITGLAVMVRRPFLDLGLIPYRAARTIVTYSWESSVPDMPADDQYTPEEEAQYGRLMRYMAKKHPRLASYMDGMGGAEPGPTSTEPPPAPYAAPAGTTMSYQQLDARLRQEQSERLLDRVSGTVKFDRTRELATLSAMPEAQRPAHVQYMLDTYQRLPTGSQPIDTNTPASPPAAPAGMSRAQMEAAVQYMSAQNLPYETARAWALANVK
jgi:hypothetical protein